MQTAAMTSRPVAALSSSGGSGSSGSSRSSSALRPAAVRRRGAPPRAAAPDAPPAAAASGVTIEYQRAQAKAMQQYFRDLKEEETAAAAQVFGWTRRNEISNGRWVMMGLAIGLLTEYATGVSFPDQLRLMVSYLGLWDLDY